MLWTVAVYKWTCLASSGLCLTWPLPRLVSLTFWLLLLVFISMYYVSFYVVMCGLFALSIFVLLYTLDPYTPDYQDRLQSPGSYHQSTQAFLMEVHRGTWRYGGLTSGCFLTCPSGVMVWPDAFNDEALDISYNMSDKKSWTAMTQRLENLLKRVFILQSQYYFI